MKRLAVATVTVFLVVATAAAAASERLARANGPTAATAATAARIVLGGRQGAYGPWRRYLWVKFDRFDIKSFTVCGIWNKNPKLPPACRTPRGVSLPAGTRLVLEQRRARPVWKAVAFSNEASLQAVLSNTVAGNRRGTVTYRVVLRSRTGQRLATSNAFKVVWAKK